MKQGIGSIALYNIIIIFIVITFAILAGTMSYSKAFKVNNRIINAIEEHEGYTGAAAESINAYLSGIGYQYDSSGKCSTRRGVEPMQAIEPKNHRFCVYPYELNTRFHNGKYYKFGVVTYIYLDFPIVGQFIRIPVYGETNRIFCFEKSSECRKNFLGSD